MTFPFLFGVMFGDIAHGTILFIAASYLCLNYDFNVRHGKDFNIVIQARFMLLFMGAFSIFCGFIYNDFMSISLNLFGSCWTPSKSDSTSLQPTCTYPFGLDPIWGASDNKLLIQNSYKMKLAVVLGVTQMLVGVIFKGLNCIYFRRFVDLIFEFLPQLLFLLSTFGYMVFLIFLKWSTDYSANTNLAPSILGIMLDFGLENGKVKKKDILFA